MFSTVDTINVLPFPKLTIISFSFIEDENLLCNCIESINYVESYLFRSLFFPKKNEIKKTFKN